MQPCDHINTNANALSLSHSHCVLILLLLFICIVSSLLIASSRLIVSVFHDMLGRLFTAIFSLSLIKLDHLAITVAERRVSDIGAASVVRIHTSSRLRIHVICRVRA